MLFTVAKIWKQPKCPSVGEWMKELWYTYTVEYYAAIKKKELLPFAAMWKDLETIMLSERSQSEEDKHHEIPRGVICPLSWLAVQLCLLRSGTDTCPVLLCRFTSHPLAPLPKPLVRAPCCSQRRTLPACHSSHFSSPLGQTCLCPSL